MRLHTIEHVPFEGPAAIGHYAGRKKLELGRTRVFAGEAPPELSPADLLVVLGGPMSVHDVAEHPWLAREKAYLRDAVKKGVGILGVCLGAQLLSEALGGTVARNPVKEIGWHEVRLAAPADRHRVTQGFQDRFMAFHWHGDTFSLPPGASLLASSAACGNQAFCIDTKWVGLQFHLETTEDSMERLVANCPQDLDAGPAVQSVDEMRRGLGHLQGMQRLLELLLDNMTADL